MTLTLPPDIADLVSRAGGRFPQADEDSLHSLSEAWRKLSGEFAALKDRGSDLAQQIIGGQQSAAIDRFGRRWREFERQADTAVEAAQACAGAAQAMARAVLATKQAIAEAGGVVYRKILELRRMAATSGGIACGVGRAIVWLLRTFGRQILRFLGSLLKLIGRGIAWLFRRAYALIVAFIAWLKRFFTRKPAPPKPPPKPPAKPPPTPKRGSDVLQELKNLPPGKQSHVRTVRSDSELRELFQKWTQGGKDVTPSGFNGTRVQLPDGSIVQLRNASKSGGATIDVNVPGSGPMKVHIQ